MAIPVPPVEDICLQTVWRQKSRFQHLKRTSFPTLNYTGFSFTWFLVICGFDFFGCGDVVFIGVYYVGDVPCPWGHGWFMAPLQGSRWVLGGSFNWRDAKYAASLLHMFLSKGKMCLSNILWKFVGLIGYICLLIKWTNGFKSTQNF